MKYEILSYAEMNCFVREYQLLLNEDPESKRPWQYSLEYVYETASRMIRQFVRSRVSDGRVDEVFAHVWEELNERPWDWYPQNMDLVNFLDNTISDYLQQNPRKFRSIDDKWEPSDTACSDS